MISLTSNTYWLNAGRYFKRLAGQEEWQPVSHRPFAELLPAYSPPAQLTLFDPSPFTNKLVWGNQESNGQAPTQDLP